MQGYCVLAAGGISSLTSETATASAEVYAGFKGTWTATTSLPGTRAYHAASGYENKVLVAGGRTGATILDTAYVYNADTAAWTATAAVLSQARYRLQASTSEVFLGAEAWFVGGATTAGGAPSGATDVYDWVAESWKSSHPNLATPRYNHALAIWAGGGSARYALVAGGETGSGKTASAEYSSGSTWHPATDLEVPVASLAVAVTGAAVYLAGGTSGTAQAELYRIPVSSPTKMSLIGTLNRARGFAVAAPIGDIDRVLVVGSSNNSETIGPDGYIGESKMTAPLRTNHQLVALPNNKVMANGGYFVLMGNSYWTHEEIYSPIANGGA